ncbi:MAG: GGDEF domain-containing protein [Spirochaetales bacterium]|nr:GGDEF domain-containing protein [Spirochaetales bacterium]
MAAKRPTIGFHTEKLIRQGYLAQLLDGAISASNEHDVNLYLFPGLGLNAPYPETRQYNVVFEFSNKNCLDGLLVASGMICNTISDKDLNIYYERYSPLPVLSIGILMNNIPSITVDNKSGIIQGISHLVVTHNKKRILYIGGPRKNQEAMIRLKAFKDGLVLYKIPYREEFILEGDFRFNSGYVCMMEFIKKYKVTFDSVLAANDEMALGCIKALTECRVKVPQEVAVIGFDDIEAAELNLPPLTTVRQPVFEIGQKALELVLKAVNNEEIEHNTVLRTNLIVRNSCGCLSDSLKFIDRNIIRTGEFGNKIKSINRQNRETVFNSLVKSLHVSNRKKMTDLIIGCEDIIRKNPQSPTLFNELFPMFQTFLQIQLSYDPDVNKWHNFISLLREYILLQFGGDKDSRIRIETLFHEIRTQITLLIHQSQALLRFELADDLRNLNSFISQLSSSLVMKEILGSIQNDLERADIKSCFFAFYDKEIPNTAGMIWKQPEKASIIMAYDDQEMISCYPDTIPFPVINLLPEGMLKDRRYTLVVKPLFFMEEQFGFMLFELGQRMGIVYETLWLEMSAALKTILLYNAQKKAEENLLGAMNALEEANVRLRNISQQDDLTGLLNRRGFLSLSEKTINVALRLKKNGILFYGDLDGLKTINDTHGHKEGDWAICQTAKILENIFRREDVVARFGGDEFVVLCIDPGKKFEMTIQEKLKKELANTNKNAAKPFKISITLGYVAFNHTEYPSMERLIGLADYYLYEQKKKRKGR